MKTLLKPFIVLCAAALFVLNSNDAAYCGPDPDIDSIKTNVEAIIDCPSPLDSTCLDIVSGHPWSEDSKLVALDSNMRNLFEKENETLAKIDSLVEMYTLIRREIDSLKNLNLQVSQTTFNNYYNTRTERNEAMARIRYIDLIKQEIEFYVSKTELNHVGRNL